MKRYGNYYDDNDVFMPSSGNYLGQVITKVGLNSNIIQVRDELRSHSNVLFEETHHHQLINKLMLKNTNIYVDVMVFEYNGKIYYWWDMYREKEYVKSALEFIVRSGNTFMTHVWFATESTQTPFICTIKDYIKNEFK